MRKLLIRLLGGYASISDAIDAVRDKEEMQRDRILTLAVKKLFNTIGEDDILHEDALTGKWYFKRREVSDAEKRQLQAEAYRFTETLLYKTLKADIQWQANRKMFILGKDPMDLVAGKLWLYTFDTIETRIHSIGKQSGMFNPKK